MSWKSPICFLYCRLVLWRDNLFCCQIQPSRKYFCLATTTHLYLILYHRRHYVHFHQQVALNIKIGNRTFHLGKPRELRDERENLSMSTNQMGKSRDLHESWNYSQGDMDWVKNIFVWDTVENIYPLPLLTVLKGTAFRWTLYLPSIECILHKCL